MSPSTGIPYIAGEFSGLGRYQVVCPVCWLACEAQTVPISADDIIQGAQADYAQHYAAAHLPKAGHTLRQPTGQSALELAG